MDKSAGLVIDIIGVPFSPTLEELEMIVEIQGQLNGLQKNCTEPLRNALAEYAKDPDFILVYIRGRKRNLPKVVDSIKRFAEIRYEKYPELFPELVPDYVRYIIDHRIFDMLRHRDHLGRIVAVFNFEKWDHRKASLEELLVAVRYIIDFGLRAPEALVSGFCVIINCSGASLRHLKQFTLSIIIKAMNTFVLAYPFPLKGCYVINAPALVKSIYVMARPFLPTKFNERVMITSGVKDLQRYISPALLPKSMGGTLSEVEALSLDFLELPN